MSHYSMWMLYHHKHTDTCTNSIRKLNRKGGKFWENNVENIPYMYLKKKTEKMSQAVRRMLMQESTQQNINSVILFARIMLLHLKHYIPIVKIWVRYNPYCKWNNLFLFISIYMVLLSQFSLFIPNFLLFIFPTNAS